MFTNVSIDGIEYFWFFLATNKMLEQLFGILLSLRRGNLNFDFLDLWDRLGDTVLIQWIYPEYLEWDELWCRLTKEKDSFVEGGHSGCQC